MKLQPTGRDLKRMMMICNFINTGIMIVRNYMYNMSDTIKYTSYSLSLQPTGGSVVKGARNLKNFKHKINFEKNLKSKKLEKQKKKKKILKKIKNKKILKMLKLQKNVQKGKSEKN